MVIVEFATLLMVPVLITDVAAANMNVRLAFGAVTRIVPEFVMVWVIGA